MSRAKTPRAAVGSITLALCAAAFAAAAACGPAGGEAQDPHAHDDHQAEGHEDEVHLDQEQLAAAGIEAVAAAPGTIEETVHLAARVSSNEDTVVHVTPRIDGIVQAIHTGLGEQVKAGDPLAELWSVELGNTISAWLRARATALAAEETLAKAQELYRQRLQTVTVVLDGEIAVARTIQEREAGLQEKGIATIRPYLEADRDLQRAVLAKQRELTALAAERDTRLLELDVAVRQARIEATAAEERLLVLGFDEPEIAAFATEEQRRGRMLLSAPRDGVVLERHITLNEHVDTEDTLFVVHDLSTVWVLASAYEKDLARLRRGQKAYVRLHALPRTELVGAVSAIDFQISAATRAAAVRIELPNGPVEGWPVEFPLRPGMFGEVEIVVDSRAGRVVLPEEAIVHEGEDSFVFVQHEGEPGAFQRKPVKVRPGAHELVEIVEGVEPGEHVVVKGTFTLKSLARGSELGEGHGH